MRGPFCSSCASADSPPRLLAGRRKGVGALRLYPSLRARRSNPRFRRRPLTDLPAPSPLTPQVLETVLHDRFWGFAGGRSRGEMDCFATLAMTERSRRAPALIPPRKSGRGGK